MALRWPRPTADASPTPPEAGNPESDAPGSDASESHGLTTDQTQMSAGDRRRHARSATRGMKTPFGVITDLSEYGARVYRKGSLKVAVGQEVVLKVREATIRLDLPARVSRCTHCGFWRTEVGLEFLDTTAEQRQSLRILMDYTSPEISPRVWLAA